jgi:hypothetical protein
MTESQAGSRHRGRVSQSSQYQDLERVGSVDIRKLCLSLSLVYSGYNPMRCSGFLVLSAQVLHPKALFQAVNKGGLIQQLYERSIIYTCTWLA